MCTDAMMSSGASAALLESWHAQALSRRAWLDAGVSAAEALSLCGALPEQRVSATQANPAVNSVHSPEGPELLLAPS